MGLDIGECVCGKGGRAHRKTRLSPSSPKAPEELLTMALEPSAPQQGHQQPQVDQPADPSPGKQEWLPTSFPIKSLHPGVCQMPFPVLEFRQRAHQPSPCPHRTLTLVISHQTSLFWDYLSKQSCSITISQACQSERSQCMSSLVMVARPSTMLW